MRKRTICALVAALFAISVAATAKTVIEKKLRPDPKKPYIAFFNGEKGLDESFSEAYTPDATHIIIVKSTPRYSILGGYGYYDVDHVMRKIEDKERPYLSGVEKGQ